MLVIGDLALKQFRKDHKVDNIEIIGFKDYEIYIENTLNASKTSTLLSNICKLYDLKENRKLLYFSANENFLLRNLLDETFSKDLSFKYASPQLLYILESIKITERFHNIINWEESIFKFNYLLRTHILPLREYEPKILKLLEIKSIEYHDLAVTSNLLDKTKFKYRNFDIFKEDDIHNIFTLSIRNTYNNVSFGKEKCLLQESVWKTYNHNEKILTVLERAYVIAINEFVIPHWLEKKKMPINAESLLKKALMIITSTTNSTWFATFIAYNYTEIIQNFNPQYINIFNNAIKYNDLEEIK